MRILFLTQWFDPEPALKDAAFARALADAGHEVEVATGFPNYPGGKLFPGYKLRPYFRETIKGLTIHRLWLYPSHDSSSLKRVLNYVSFFVSALIFGLLRGARYDAVYIYHPPLTPALAAALFCGFHRKPFVVDIQDLWPDSVGASGMANPRIVGALERACKFVYRRAAALIAQSDGMHAELARRGVPAERLTTVFNWATYQAATTEQALPSTVAQSFADRLNLVFGGNMGQAQQLSVVVEAAIMAHRTDPRIRLHLVGSGIEREALEDLVREKGAEEAVHFHAPVARDIMDRVFDAADVLVMHLKDDPLYLITIPSKIQHYLACGKAIVAGVPGEAADILRASEAALVVAPGDPEAFATAIGAFAASPQKRTEAGSRGRRTYENRYSFEAAINNTLRVIARSANDSRDPS